MNIKAARSESGDDFADRQRRSAGHWPAQIALVLPVAYGMLFLGMSLRPTIYDEGLVLTAAMRVAAGQVPHRDFYANYGPAQFYILAGLFKAFGPSVFVERLYDLGIKALLVASVFALLSSYCRRAIAGGGASVVLLWLFYLSDLAGTPVMAVSLLNLVGLALILPAFVRSLSAKRTLVAGAVAGAAALFRYDTGIALLGIQGFVLGGAIYLNAKPGKLRLYAITSLPCLVGFALVTVPCVILYLSVAPVHAFVHDILFYPSRFYYLSRHLPFPRVSRKALENLEVYLPLLAIGLSICGATTGYKRVRNKTALAPRKWMRVRGFLFSFSLLAFAMYFKGFVRVQILQMYLSIVPSILLTALLFQYRAVFGRFVQSSILVLAGFSALAVISSTLHTLKGLAVYHVSVPQRIVSSVEGTSSDTQAKWCRIPGPLTTGICFLPDDDRIHAIEFITGHTVASQRLYVGLRQHDKIFVNDNLIYFATQRLPATKWSHFDPHLQNSQDVQHEMIGELDASKPPLIVLDSEFDQVSEPNDSSRSTGVTMLDEYIRKKYEEVETFGDLAVWRWIN